MKTKSSKLLSVALLLILACVTNLSAQVTATETSGTTKYVPVFGTVPNMVNSQIHDNGTTAGSGGIGINTTSGSSWLNVMVPHVSSTSENCFSITVDDASGDYFAINSGTTADGVFAPTLFGHIETMNNRIPVAMIGSVNSSLDGSGNTNPMMLFDSRQTSAAIANRPLFAWNSFGNNKMQMDHAGNLGIGTTSPGAKLEVDGASGASILNLKDNSGTLQFSVGSSGTTMMGNNANLGPYGIGALEIDHNSSTMYPCFLRNGAGTGRGLRIKAGFYNDTFPLLQLEANNFSGAGYNTVGNVRMVVLNNGQVGIGTQLHSNPNNYLLAVNGSIGASGTIVVENTSTTWPDYVFEKDYKAMSLPDLEMYVTKEKHLPGVQSEDELKKHGDDLVKNEAAILKNLEELSLHLIELQKENEALKTRIAALENK